ncbi:Toxin FitB [Brevundimonas sp. NIBR10]|uniref:type II toxin-antitoxin system VapC family toxin n=1 Tax=Brevundimonas sp. NIBR10 TaxID=3015997 RepID=UPI0022F15C29|nr:type II toxin-antitoxin system VapC family toxin [Brevundimonas sp. NIBR10]WGM46210.1 Toxin FitB [Brevundimonas sp. NIBR10]
MYLLDTNAVSEPGRLHPDAGFLAWFDATPEPLQYVSVLTIGELRHGTQAMVAGRQRAFLEGLQVILTTRHRARVLDVDIAVVKLWADIALENKRNGRRPGAIDELIAATALLYDFTVVTRNVRDFQTSGCKLLSPWTG